MSDSDLQNYVGVLNRWKRFILGIVGTVAVASLVISFFLPKWYAARSSLIPPQQNEIGGILASLVQGVSVPGIPSLAPTSGESQLFLAILDSRTVREELVRKHDLMKVYKTRTMDDALKTLGTLARASLTDRGVVEVVVEDRNPKRAADIANDWVAALDQFNKTSRMTAGRRNREFIQTRLTETLQTLTAAENGLSAYQQSHPDAPMSTELSAAVEGGASLMARRMALQVRLSMAREIYRDGSPQVAQIQGELVALDSQIALLPPLAMEFARLLRDLKIQEQVYALLMAQFEEARIQENRDMPTLEILDRASPPERRVRPIRWLFCTSLTLAALVLSVGTAFVVEFGRRIRSAARA